MECLLSVLKICIVISAMSPAGLTQMIIKPRQDELEDLCPGDVVFITCETRGSTIIAWTSEEYIEQGGTQLELATFNRVGDTRISPVNPNTVAALIENSRDSNGSVVLVSRLRIKVSVDSTVTCINVGNGMSTSIRIQILANPERSQIRAYQVGADNNCDLHLSWNIPSNISTEDVSHFIVQINETNMNHSNEITHDGSSMFTVYRQCSCGSHRINISAVNRCDSPGESTLLIVEDEAPVSNMMECPGIVTTTGLASNDDSECQGLMTIIIALSAVLATMAAALLIMCTCMIAYLIFQLKRRVHIEANQENVTNPQFQRVLNMHDMRSSRPTTF